MAPTQAPHALARRVDARLTVAARPDPRGLPGGVFYFSRMVSRTIVANYRAMEAEAGLEPATCGFRARCPATGLLRYGFFLNHRSSTSCQIQNVHTIPNASSPYSPMNPRTSKCMGWG